MEFVRSLGLGALDELNAEGHSVLHLGIERLRLGEDFVEPLLLVVQRVPLWLLDRTA